MGTVLHTLVLFLVGLMGPSLYAYEAAFTQFAPKLDENYKIDYSHLLTDKNLNLSALEKDQFLYSNFDEFLAYLNANYPDLFAQPVFLHHTASLQKATFTDPRVLIYGRGIVLSFADQNNKEKQSVEIIEFDPATSRFKMGELVFERGRPTKFNHEPNSCVACHGENPKPIWAPYDVWINAYGSRAGSFGSRSEGQKYFQFLEVGDSGVHKYIQDIDNPSLLTGEKLDALDAFTEYVSSLNLFKLMTELKQKSQLKPFRYAIAAVVNGCTLTEYQPDKNYESDKSLVKNFIPKSLHEALPISLESLYADSKAARRSSVSYFIKEYDKRFSSHSESRFSITERLDSEIPTTADLRYILENAGVDLRSLVMTNGENHFSLSVPSNVSFDLTNALVLFDESLFEELKPEKSEVFGISYPKFDCAKLKALSLAELNRAQEQNELNLPIDAKMTTHSNPHKGFAPMGQCVRCHSMMQTRAPRIPFDDTMAFRGWLSQTGNKDLILKQITSGKMPKGNALSLKEKDAFMAAIERLSQ